jgi:hypothetical protein
LETDMKQRFGFRLIRKICIMIDNQMFLQKSGVGASPSVSAIQLIIAVQVVSAGMFCNLNDKFANN